MITKVHIVGDSIYLKGSHDGWAINLYENGLEVISPALAELEVVQEHFNAVRITEKLEAD